MNETGQSNLKSIIGWSLLVLSLAAIYFFPESFGLPSAQTSPGVSNSLLSNNSSGQVAQNNSPGQYIVPTAVIIPTRALTPTRDCNLWNEIGAWHKGKILCVQGIVYSTGSDKVAYYIKFSPSMTAFYFVSYAYIYPDVKPGMCVRASGIVKQIGNTPVILLDESVQHLKKCN